MKKVIEFRAWHTPSKTMISWDDIKELMLHGVEEPFDNPDYIMMQKIWPVDRDKGSVFESDYVSDRGYCADELYKIVGQTVSGWEPTNSYLDHDKGILSCKVVGNIYQNPELRKGLYENTRNQP